MTTAESFAHPPFFNIVMAIDEGRGFGLNQRLPWPHIKTDYEHYRRISRTPSVEGKKIVHIIGRKTHECSNIKALEQSKDILIKIVISQSLKECPPYVEYVAKSFEDALKHASSSEMHKQAEDIWILGGERVLEAALVSPWCRRLYLTRVEGKHKADAFMPTFEDNFVLVRDPNIREDVIEENGVRFKFEVYEPKCNQTIK